MTKNIKIDKIINIIWLLAVVVVAVSLLMTKEAFGLRCITDIVEQKEYYVEYLWPAIYSKTVRCTLGVVIVALLVYVGPFMDFDVNQGGVSYRKIKNIGHITASLVLVFYILFTLLFMKGYSHWMIYFSVVILMGIGFTIRNVIICKKMKNDDVEKEKKEETEEDEDKSTDIDGVWKPVLKYFNIVLIAVGICVLCFCINLKQKVEGAKAVHHELNYDLIRLSFAHEHGMEENRALVKLMFVNLYNESGRQYSMEVLEEEYANFKNGTGTWSTLWQFCRDSVEIELEEEDDDTVYLKVYGTYIPEGSSYAAEYFLGDDYQYEKSARKDYGDEAYDLFADLATYTYNVEINLNSKGLTMMQSNDSSAYDREMDFEFWSTFTSATTDEVYAACEEVFLGEDEIQVSINQMHFEVSNVGAGDCVTDSVVETETEYVTIADVSYYEVERISGVDYLRDELKGEEGVFQAGEKYTARVTVQLPVYAIVSDLTSSITVDGLEYERIVHSVRNTSACIEVTVDIVFRAQ